MSKCYGEELIDLFPIERGGRISIAGAIGSGKTNLLTQNVKKYSQKFNKVLNCGTSYHPIRELPELKNKIVISKDSTDPELEIDERVANVFSKKRYRGIGAILILQNIFRQGKYARSIHLNCSNFLLLKQRDLGQIETLDR